MKFGSFGMYTVGLHARVWNRVSKEENTQWPTRVEYTPVCSSRVSRRRNSFGYTEQHGLSTRPSAQVVRVEGGHKKTQVSQGCTHGLSTRHVIKSCVLAKKT